MEETENQTKSPVVALSHPSSICVSFSKAVHRENKEGTWFPSQGLEELCAVTPQALLFIWIHYQWLHTSALLHIFANTCASCKEIPWATQGSQFRDDGNGGYSAASITKPFPAISGFDSKFALKNSKQAELSSNNRARQIAALLWLLPSLLFCFVFFCCSFENNFLKRERKKGKYTGTMCALLQMLLMSFSLKCAAKLLCRLMRTGSGPPQWTCAESR